VGVDAKANEAHCGGLQAASSKRREERGLVRARQPGACEVFGDPENVQPRDDATEAVARSEVEELPREHREPPSR
jgi:hypothetical protein